MTAPVHSPSPELLMAYLDGEVPVESARELLEHIETCEACQHVASDLRGVSDGLGLWQVDEPPVTLRMPGGNLPVARSWTRLARRVRIWHVPAAAAAVVLIGVAVAMWSEMNQATRSVSMPVALEQGAPRPEGGVAGLPRSSAGGAGAAPGVGAVGRQTTQAAADPMVVRTAYLRIVADDFEAVRSSIDRIVADLAGSIAQLHASDTGTAPRSIRATLRVPPDRLDSALAAFRQLGRVIDESQGAEDVTEQAVDLDARLSNARTTEKRLSEMLQSRTGRVADVLEVEREIARVRTEIERLYAQRQNLGRRVSDATLTLDIGEVPKASVSLGHVPLWSRVRYAAAQGLELAAGSLIAVSLLLLHVGPGLLAWGGLIGLPAWFIIRRRRADAGVRHLLYPDRTPDI